jgi:demethylmenaquinone methyltransferase/2-methoxy-6-polyprenyl-1,4-benzoquinol methylase
VLAPGGHLLVLDFSMPGPPLRAAYRFYLHRLLPRIAGAVTGRKEAYEYLGDSIEKFPAGFEMISLIAESGFAGASCEPLTGGIVSVYTAIRADYFSGSTAAVSAS